MDQSLVDSSPWLFAATHVLHLHLAPRHPPLALRSLGYSLCCKISNTTCFSDARARYAVLKGRVRRTDPPRGHHADVSGPGARNDSGQWPASSATPSKRNSE